MDAAGYQYSIDQRLCSKSWLGLTILRVHFITSVMMLNHCIHSLRKIWTKDWAYTFWEITTERNYRLWYRSSVGYSSNDSINTCT